MIDTMCEKLLGPEDKRGVSPVIGVILMVTITVILAAVIAAFVLDIGPGDADPNVSFELDDGGDTDVEVTLKSLDGTADGIAIVEGTDNDDSVVDDPLTVSGQSDTYNIGSEYVLVAYSADEEPDDVGEMDNIAILDDLEEYHD